jgi:hypothetical protein
MNVSLDLSRSECITAIGNKEIEQITRASIEHLAIPLIAGFSMDQVSQQQYEEMGGRGAKPSPLSTEAKLEIYTRMKEFIKAKIVNEIAKLVNSVLEQSLESLTDEELRLKVAALKEKVVEAEPNWEKLPDLFKDHVCLFKELQKSTHLKADLVSFHEILCPIICRYRDSGELFARIKMHEFLS